MSLKRMTELKAANPDGHNQWTQGGEHTVKAVEASKAANASSKTAIETGGIAAHQGAADLHTEAQIAHTRAAEVAQNDGKKALAQSHREAASAHGTAAWDHNMMVKKIESKMVDAKAASPDSARAAVLACSARAAVLACSAALPGATAADVAAAALRCYGVGVTVDEAVEIIEAK